MKKRITLLAIIATMLLILNCGLISVYADDPNPNYVYEAEATIVAPIAGNAPDDTVVFPNNNRYTVEAFGDWKVGSAEEYDATNGINPTVFEYGKTYSIQVRITGLDPYKVRWSDNDGTSKSVSLSVSGQDVYWKGYGDNYLYGTIEFVAGCENHQRKLVNEKAATTEDEGYSGDYICSICGEMIEMGINTPVLFEGGDGTEQNPYQIASKKQLNAVRYYLNAHFILLNDIEFDKTDFDPEGEFYNEGAGWMPIGGSAYRHEVNTAEEFNTLINRYGELYRIGHDAFGDRIVKVTEYDDFYNDYYNVEDGFAGSFDGNGHAIKSIKIDNVEKDPFNHKCGLFGWANRKGTINNLGVEDIDYRVSLSSRNLCYCGGILGYSYNSEDFISGCYATGTIAVYGKRDISPVYVGGIVGQGYVEKSYNACSIYMSGDDVGSCGGGIAGLGSVSNCFNTGTITAPNQWYDIGGICGSGGNAGNTLCSACYNMGYVMRGDISIASSGTIRHCYSYNKYSVNSSTQQVINLSLDELKDKENLEWLDFENTWQIGVNSKYPFPELRGVKNVVTDISTCDVKLSSENVSLPESPTIEIKDGANILVKYQDYIAVYENYDTPGKAHVIIDGRGKYVGTTAVNYTVGPYNLENSRVLMKTSNGGYMSYNNNYSVTYNGSEQTVGPLRVESLVDDRSIIPDSSYTITYKDNKNVGKAKIILVGDGITSVGTINLEFRIQPDPDHKFQAKDATFTYDGQPHTINISNPKSVGVVYSDSGTTGTFTAEPVYKTEAGTYRIYYYNDDKNFDYFTNSAVLTINQSSITNATVEGIVNKVYTGSSIRQNITVSVSDGARFLTPEVDYTIHYYNNTNVGTASLEIIGIGNYCDSIKKTFSISEKIISNLPTVKISKPKAAKKSATIKWKEVSKANQKKIAFIQIQYSLDRSFNTGVKTITVKKSAKSKKIKNLTSKKKYYVRIRAYKKTGNIIYISKWSAIKPVKVK